MCALRLPPYLKDIAKADKCLSSLYEREAYNTPRFTTRHEHATALKNGHWRY